MDTSQFATKQDLEDLYRRIEKMVGEVVGEIVSDALKLINERFDRLEARMDWAEDKLDRTAATVDLHAVDIRALKRKAA
jgi:hypothetical protein